MKLIDLTGLQFGSWTVIEKSLIKDKHGHPKWTCKCICGTISNVLGSTLRSGRSLRCRRCATHLLSENKIVDISNKIFGHWKVIEYDRASIGRRDAFWLCECKCKQIFSIRAHALLSGKSKCCRNCYYSRTDNYDYLLKKIVEGANRRNLSVSITKYDLINLFQKQNNRCALSGVLLQLGVAGSNFLNIRKWKEQNTVSVDRIDSSKGYTVDNIQIVHKHINLMKLDFNQTEFINYCRLVAEKNK